MLGGGIGLLRSEVAGLLFVGKGWDGWICR